MPTSIKNNNLLLKYSAEGNKNGVIEILKMDDVDINYIPNNFTRSVTLKYHAITLATINGHKDIVDLLIEKNANINCHQDNNRNYLESPLYHAIENNNFEIAKSLIKSGKIDFNTAHPVHFNGKTHGHYSAVNHAAKKGYSEIVLELISAGVDLYPRGKYHDNFDDHGYYNYNYCKIHTAINILKNCNISLIENLISKNIFTINSFHEYFTAEFIRTNSTPELIDLIINKGLINFQKIPTAQQDYYSNIFEIKRSNPNDELKIKKILLKHGAKITKESLLWIFDSERLNDNQPNIKGKLNITPLMVAAQNGDLSMVNRYLDNGADIYAINDAGGTALTMAARFNHYEVLEILALQNSVNIFLTAVKNNDLDTVRAQIKLRAIDINYTDKDGKNLLMLACDRKNIKAAEILLDKYIWHIDLFMKDQKYTDIFYPAEAQIDINAKDKYGNTALANACKNRNIDAAEFLLKNGANIDIKNNDGNTPLMLSCIAKGQKIANFLLKNKADINAKNNDGNTALMLSCIEKDQKTVDILLSGIQITRIKITNQGKTRYEEINILDIDAKNNSYETAMSLIAKHMGIENTRSTNRVENIKCLSIIDSLLENGADPLVGDDNYLHNFPLINTYDAHSSATQSFDFDNFFLPHQPCESKKRPLSIAKKTESKRQKNNMFSSDDQLLENEESHNPYVQLAPLKFNWQNSVYSDFDNSSTEFGESPAIGVYEQYSFFSQNAMNDQNP